MGDLNKKAVAEQTEGVGAWKSRQKVNKMFLARTIKNQMVTELMFEKQRKVKQLNTEAADEEKKSKKKRRKNSTSSSDSEIEVINENEKECIELNSETLYTGLRTLSQSLASQATHWSEKMSKKSHFT